MSTKCLLFQLPIALEYHTWYQIYAKVQPLYLMIKYTNYLSIIFLNINENIINERKSYKTTPISAAMNYKFPNLVPNQSLDNFVLFCNLVRKLSNQKRHAC